MLSFPRERLPLPDMGSSSSAKASKEMRSAAFLFGLLLGVSVDEESSEENVDWRLEGMYSEEPGCG